MPKGCGQDACNRLRRTDITMKKRVVYREHWDNTLIEIIDNGDCRSLLFGGSVLQSSMSLTAPHRLVLSYTRCMMAPLLANDAPERVLIVGIGAGSLVRFLYHHLSSCRIVGVDIAPHIVKLAYGYFLLPDSQRFTVHYQDGYDYLSHLPKSEAFDLILIDAFNGAGMAESVYNPAFFALCRQHLQPAGLISINLWSGDKDKMASVKRQINARFGPLLALPVPHRGNVICIAGNQTELSRLATASRQRRNQLGDRFSIDFDEITGVCRKNNLTGWQRLASLFR